MRSKFLIKIAALFFTITPTSFALAKELKLQSEEIADQSYYRQNLITLLYDKDIDYRTSFKCESVMFEKPNDKGAIDTACVTGTDILWISTTMGPKRRLSSAYVCPTKQDNSLIKKLQNLSYEKDNLAGGASQYRMGLTNGWFRKFENIFVMLNMNGVSLTCWSLNRR